MRRYLFIPLLLMSATGCFGQERPNETKIVETPTAPRIVVYRNSYHATVGKAAPNITVNDEVPAVLDDGRYFNADVPAGTLLITSGKKKGNRVDIDHKAGETYYLRVRAHPGVLFARFELFRITKEEAEKDIEKLKYVKTSDIKSKRVLSAPTP